MATFPPLLALKSHCHSRGAMELSKLNAVTQAKRIGSLNIVPKPLCRHIRTVYGNIKLRAIFASQVSVDQTEKTLTRNGEVDHRKKGSNYLFRTETGGHVKVSVTKINVKYVATIEVSSLQHHGGDSRLVLVWGVYRSDSTCFMSVDCQDSAPGADSRTIETPLVQVSPARYVLELEFEEEQTPLYLSFLLNSGGTNIRSHLKRNFCVPVGFNSGSPSPLGLSISVEGRMNFAFFSRNAETVVLCFYDGNISDKPALELDLDPYVNRSGDIWHASMESVRNFVTYGYRCKGTGNERGRHLFHAEQVILDPYAKIVVSSTSNGKINYLGQLCKAPDFDWGGDIHPNIPIEKLVVYRLNVMRFTEHKSSQLPAEITGTFCGITEKVRHLKDLGINAVLLEPIFSFNENKGPYFPCHFFSPMYLYGPSNSPTFAIDSMKEMVKKLHANGVEVLLEVVYTHTADGGSLQGIDDLSYYYTDKVRDLETKNALNCNYPIVQQMILDSLRHWVTEFHVDGFCFINASSLLKGFHGESLSRPPLVEAIAFDPLLSKTKIIADFWDPLAMVAPMVTRFPHWKRWAEVNTKFCNDVRNFLRGQGIISDLATRLCGSGDIFSYGRVPAYSFNFISRNFGLPLVDLVSFSSEKLASELSWNCGKEGPTNNSAVLERRLKQIRNFLFILYVSKGVPVLNMGDECGQSSGGSPLYSDRKPFDWNALETSFGIETTQFISFLTGFRQKRSDLLQKREFLKVENIDWYGTNQAPPMWEDPTCKFLAMMLKADASQTELSSESSRINGDIYIAFNGHEHGETVTLPLPPHGMMWHRMVDTALPFPGFFSIEGEPVSVDMVGSYIYEMKSHSCALFEASIASD